MMNTMRTVAPLYNTLPAHWDKPKIMSEIKMTSQCPDGLVFVGGDCDNQEVGIASAMADSYYGVSGASFFSRTILTGNKKEGTDYHSLTAKNIVNKSEVTSDERYGGKGVNFSAIYGAGVKTIAKTIAKSFAMEFEQAYRAALAASQGFKGVKEREYLDGKNRREGGEADKFVNGIASDVFNKMFDIIDQRPPKGLFFGNEWPRTLQPEYCGDRGSPPQLNYCIQASCSTYGFLSAWVLGIWYEFKRNNIKATFSLTCHDEVWYTVPTEQAEKAAYWIMIAYARTWALLHHNLYIEDMPVVRAFPSSISIDPILRKSPNSSTKTPTFPEFSPGKEITIYDFA